MHRMKTMPMGSKNIGNLQPIQEVNISSMISLDEEDDPSHTG